MDTSKLSRQAIDAVRLVVAALVAVCGAVPAFGVFADDVSQAGENVIAIVTALSGLAAIGLQWGVVRKNVTPSSDPKTDTGVPLEPVVRP